MGHPKTLVLSSRQEVVFLDTRRGKTLQPIFSLTNQDLSTYYNVNQNENIVCFSASSHDNVGKRSCHITNSKIMSFSTLDYFYMY